MIKENNGDSGIIYTATISPRKRKKTEGKMMAELYIHINLLSKDPQTNILHTAAFISPVVFIKCYKIPCFTYFLSVSIRISAPQG